MHRVTRGRVRAALATLAAAALSLTGLAYGSPALAADAPAGLSTSSIATHGVALRWQPVTGAAGYRVRMSASKAMTNPVTWDVADPFMDWTRLDPNPTHTSARLKAGASYYFQVKALRSDKTTLSAYTKTIAATTGTSSKTAELRPERLKVTEAGATSLHVSWPSRGPGLTYRVRYTASPSTSVTRWPYVDMRDAGGTLAGLRAATRYAIRVRVTDATGAALSDYSSTITASTQSKTTSAGIVAISYNVLKASGEPTWASRRSAVAANILAQRPHILALQEATPASVTGSSGAKVPQYADLLTLLGSKYRYVTSEASSGTRLAYDSTRFRVRKADAVELWTLGSSPRFAVWAILEDRTDGRAVFVLSTHLEPSSSDATADNDARVRQAKQVLGLIRTKNPDGLPVVVAGDFNSSRATQPANGPYLTLTGGGLVDPLGDANATWIPSALRAEHGINREYNSYNNLERLARRTAWPVGTRVDYLLVSPGVRVAMARTVVNVDTSRRFVGTIPSDHNLVSLTLHLG